MSLDSGAGSAEPLHDAEGDLGDAVVAPGSSQVSGQGPGLGDRVPGQDLVQEVGAVVAPGDVEHGGETRPSESRPAGGERPRGE